MARPKKTTFESLQQEFRTLAKRINQRLVRIERMGVDEEGVPYKNTKGYRFAQDFIKYDLKVPKNKAQRITEQMKDIQTWDVDTLKRRLSIVREIETMPLTKSEVKKLREKGINSARSITGGKLSRDELISIFQSAVWQSFRHMADSNAELEIIAEYFHRLDDPRNQTIDAMVEVMAGEADRTILMAFERILNDMANIGDEEIEAVFETIEF